MARVFEPIDIGFAIALIIMYSIFIESLIWAIGDLRRTKRDLKKFRKNKRR